MARPRPIPIAHEDHAQKIHNVECTLMRRPLKRLYEMMSVGRHASRHSGVAASRVSHLEFGIGEECFQGLGRCIAQCGNRNGSVLLALYGQRERRARFVNCAHEIHRGGTVRLNCLHYCPESAARF
ncbi:hypothetical protein BCAR13_10177 [Paraburkholderia caribensis]|nr:hypothetical protein BCAR13_10177 [Paraburkholderia caribensis]